MVELMNMQAQSWYNTRFQMIAFDSKYKNKGNDVSVVLKKSQSVKNDLIRKVDNMKAELNKNKVRIKLLEIRNFNDQPHN